LDSHLSWLCITAKLERHFCITADTALRSGKSFAVAPPKFLWELILADVLTFSNQNVSVRISRLAADGRYPLPFYPALILHSRDF
jgi:hypothetical protein